MSFVTCEYTHQNYLGNSFFIMGATLTLAHQNGVEARFPEEWKHGIDKLFAKPLLPLGNRKHRLVYQEPAFHHMPIPYSPRLKIKGYFQSEKYFDADLVRDAFQPHDKLREHLDQLNEMVGLSEAVSLHVRRGDYLKLADHHPVLPIDYYIEALKGFVGMHVVIFSDDPDWCDAGLLPELSACCSNTFDVIRGADATVDLYAMTRCADHIIANSSFSWWSAYLGVNLDRRVIAPKQWFGPANAHLDTCDLIPEGWLLL